MNELFIPVGHEKLRVSCLLARDFCWRVWWARKRHHVRATRNGLLLLTNFSCSHPSSEKLVTRLGGQS
jgi:hypothetical protein